MLLLWKTLADKKIVMFEIGNLSRINPFVIFPTFAICSISLLTLYSAGGGDFMKWTSKQFAYFAIFSVAMILLATINTNILYRLSPLSYFLSVGLLISVLLFGHVSMGARRWLDLKIFNLQPSECAKIGIILALASFFNANRIEKKLFHWKVFLPFILSVIPFCLIALQPDLATALVCLIIAMGLCFLSGIRIEIFASLGLFLLSVLPFLWNNLHSYQKARIINFLNPATDPLGGGYSTMQSKIAIGSGGIFGKGLLRGGQSQLNFLPENQTDFIFTMLGEELGLFGCILVVIGYAMIISYGFLVALRCRSAFCRIIASGASLFFSVHCIVNASMVMGLLPVAGIPMPLLSYGGSASAVGMLCIGLMLHADINSEYEYF